MMNDLSIEICEGGWGESSLSNIKAVIASAAHQIWKHCPHTELNSIRIYHREDYPIVHFNRDPDGWIRVGLQARDRLWARFAYQFAHEFCHALALHSNSPGQHWHSLSHCNRWLEESICETASLFALRAMRKEWAMNPPYPIWQGYSAKLGEYAQTMIDDPQRQLQQNQGFGEWFNENEQLMRANAELREKNNIVAAQLLPLFEQEPFGWKSICFINLLPQDSHKTLAQHFLDWLHACPVGSRSFVIRLSGVFGLSL